MVKKITAETCQEIRRLRAEGYTRDHIKAQFGISSGAVSEHGTGNCSHGRPETVEVKDDLKSRTRKLLLRTKKKWTVAELSDKLDCGYSKVKTIARELQAEGNLIDLADDGVQIHREIPKGAGDRIDVSRFRGRTVRFGLTADNHLASKYARLDVLNALFDIWEEQGIDTVYQLGNMIDGDARFNKFDVLVQGIEGQVGYFVDNWPKRDGITTKFITGDDHEGWYVQREGVDIGRVIQSRAEEAGREDLIYLGHMEHDIHFVGEKTESVMRLIHAGGGSSYATSYSVQKIVESYQGGEKPNILLVGHYHKAEYGYPREVHVVQAGCTEDQSPFMRKLKIQAHLGGWTIEFDVDPNGIIHRFQTQWHPFYDREFYKNNLWGYQMRPTLINQ